MILFAVPLLGGDGVTLKSNGSAGIQTVFGSVSKLYNHKGERVDIEKFSFFESRFMLDFPVSSDFSLHVNFPFFVIHKQGKREHSGIGDCIIGLDYFLNPNNKLPLIFSVKASLPTGKTEQRDDPIPISTNELMILYQIGVPIVFYDRFRFLAAIGYQSREEPNNSAMTASSLLKYHLSEAISVVAELDYLSPIGSINTTPPNISGTANGVSYFSGSTGFEMMIGSNVQLSYSYLFAFTAANTAVLPNHHLGLSYLFSN